MIFRWGSRSVPEAARDHVETYRGYVISNAERTEFDDPDHPWRCVSEPTPKKQFAGSSCDTISRLKTAIDSHLVDIEALEYWKDEDVTDLSESQKTALECARIAYRGAHGDHIGAIYGAANVAVSIAYKYEIPAYHAFGSPYTSHENCMCVGCEGSRRNNAALDHKTGGPLEEISMYAPTPLNHPGEPGRIIPSIFLARKRAYERFYGGE